MDTVWDMNAKDHKNRGRSDNCAIERVCEYDSMCRRDKEEGMSAFDDERCKGMTKRKIGMFRDPKGTMN